MLRLLSLIPLLIPLLIATSVAAQDTMVFPPYVPIGIDHDPGAEIQVLPWDQETPEFLDEIHLGRQETVTWWCAPPGYYLLNNGSGKLRIFRITGDDTPDDPDDDPDDPDDEPDPNLQDAVRDWAEAVGDTDDSQRYALVFDTVSDGLESGVSMDVFDVLRQAADSTLKSEWSSFRDRLTQETVVRLQKGLLSPKVRMIAYLDEIQAGLELSADGATELTPGDAIGVVETTNRIIREGGQ